jgi:hypothetical protein
MPDGLFHVLGQGGGELFVVCPAGFADKVRRGGGGTLVIDRLDSLRACTETKYLIYNIKYFIMASKFGFFLF